MAVNTLIPCLIFQIPGPLEIPLGMEDGSIADYQINASTHFLGNEAWKGRLNNADVFWSQINSDPAPWIQVAFSFAVTITEIKTQGAGTSTQFVKELLIQTGDNVETLSYIMDGTNEVSLCLIFTLVYRIKITQLSHNVTGRIF